MGVSMTNSSPQNGKLQTKQDEHVLNRRKLLVGAATVAAAGVSVPAIAQAAACTDTQAGGIWWSELVAADPVQARNFYAKVAGWTAKVVSVEDNSRPPLPGEEEYTLFLLNDQEVAGLTKADATEGGNPRPGWFSYIQVASVDDAVTETVKAGGKVIRFPVDLAKVGRIAVIEDPTGAQVGLVTPIPNVPG